MIQVPKPIKGLPLKTEDLNLWVNGLNTEVDALRLGAQALSSANNMVLDQDGLLRCAPSLMLWGPQPTGTMLGKPGSFIIYDGLEATTYLISVQVIDGTAIVCIGKPEDTTWTQCSSVTLSTSGAYTFTQCAQSPKMLVLNSNNPLTYLDLTTVTDTTPTVVQMEVLADPTTAATLTANGFTGTDLFTLSYTYTLNSTVGETEAAPVATVQTPVDRSGWSGSENVSIEIPTPPTGTESWNLYGASTSSSSSAVDQFLIAQGISTSNLTYSDTGTVPFSTSTIPPISNTTDGPHGGAAVVIGGIVFVWLDGTNPFNISIGSQLPGFELDFSPSHGGQILPIAPGSGGIPLKVWNFRSGPGDPEIKCMTDDRGAKGIRYTLAQQTLTYDDNQITAWGYTEDYGFNGTVAPNSVLVFNNSTYYLGYDSFYESSTEPELQNLIDTKSNAVVLSHDDFQSINQSAVSLADASVWQNRIYFCLPIGSDTNNQIWTLDLQRGDAWMKPLDIPCDGIITVTDNSGISHQVFLVNNQLCESTYEVMTTYLGEAFPTGWGTAAIGFSADLRTWAQVITVLIVLLNAQGTANFEVWGWTDSDELVQVGSATFNSDAEGAGTGWNEGGYNQGNLLGWNLFNAPGQTLEPSVDVPISVEQRVRYMFVYGSSAAAGTDYAVSQIIPLFTVVGVENLQG